MLIKQLKLEAEVGIEPATHRLIPTRRDSTIEQDFSNPASGLHPLDQTLSKHRRSSRWMRFTPHQLPRAVLAREFAVELVQSVVRAKPTLEVVSVADIEMTRRILEDVNPIHWRKDWLQRQGSNLQPAG